MAKRKLRIVKTNPSLLCVCERCNSQFTANTEVEIYSAFDAHKCTPRMVAKTPYGSFVRRQRTNSYLAFLF
jgi:hypothetical protein